MSVDTGLIEPFAVVVVVVVVVMMRARCATTRRALRWLRARHMRALAATALAVSALAASTSRRVDGARVNRDEAFIGYSERSVPARRGGDGLIIGRETLTLSTSAGDIPIALRADWAPKLVSDILTAVRVGGACARTDGGACAFYRAEAVPALGAVDAYGGPGPPYALLQGNFEGLGNAHEKELATSAKRGYACLIGRGPDFFIATRAHEEWGRAHTVFGVATDAGMDVVDAIAENKNNLFPVTRETWGETNVTTLVEKVYFSARVDDDGGGA